MKHIHILDENGMLLCNPRDKEASHRATMGKVFITSKVKVATCKKCLKRLPK